MTQEFKAGSEPDGRPEPAGAGSQPPRAESAQSAQVQDPASLREDLKSAVAEEVGRQLATLGSAESVSAAHEAHVERKLRDAFSAVAGVRSVAYTRGCDQWTLIVTYDDDDESAFTRLIDNLSGACFGDPLMPAFEPWILHVSKVGANVPAGEKPVISR